MDQNYERYVKDLPVIPEVALKILRIAEDSPDISSRELENIIKIDPGLATRIIKISNSALYARPKEIKSLQMAITMLGFTSIKSLVLLVSVSNTFAKLKRTEFYQRFWKHTILTAFLAKHITQKCSKTEYSEEAFLGALLHDIGQVAFFNADRSKYQEIMTLLQSGSERIEELEERFFSINHLTLGAAILQKWNFPPLFVDIAGQHGRPEITSSYKKQIIVISLADILAELLVLGEITPQRDELLSKFSQQAGLAKSEIAYYREEYREDLKRDPLFQECQDMFGIVDQD